MHHDSKAKKRENHDSKAERHVEANYGDFWVDDDDFGDRVFQADIQDRGEVLINLETEWILGLDKEANLTKGESFIMWGTMTMWMGIWTLLN